MSLIEIRDRAYEIALTQIGVREEGGRNRGPDVERYLHAVGLKPGHEWCCAGVVWCYDEAAKAFQMELPLRRTGKCARLWAKANGIWKSSRPTLKAIYIHLEDPDDPDSKGHCGIVTDIADRSIAGVEFNTNALGSRIGDRVRINTRAKDYVNAGYIDIGREGPADLPVFS